MINTFVCYHLRLNAKYQAQPFGYGFKPNLFTPNNAAGLQLVPYTQSTEIASNQKVPLTPEQLDNLYKMNYAVQPYSAIANPNVYSYNMPRPVAPPPIFYPSNSVPVTPFTSNPPPFQHQPLESNNSANYNPSLAGTSYSAASSNTSQQYFNQNVINPQSALVHVPKVCIYWKNSIVLLEIYFFYFFCSCHPNKIQMQRIHTHYLRLIV